MIGNPAVHGTQTVGVNRDYLAGMHVPDIIGVDLVQGACLRSDHPAAVELADAEWPDAHRIANTVHGVLGHHRQGVRALKPPHGIDDALFQCGRRSVRQEVRDDLRIAGGGELRAPRLELRPELPGVYDVAIVGQGDLHAGAPRENRLGVLDAAATGGGVPGVADAKVAGEECEIFLVERLGDEPHCRPALDLPAVARGDARALLPAMLEGMEAEVGGAGRVLSG